MYLFIVDVLSYQVKMSMFYSVETPKVGKNEMYNKQ